VVVVVVVAMLVLVPLAMALPTVDVIEPTFHHDMLTQSHVTFVPQDLRQRQYIFM